MYFSFIIPVYNRPQEILELLESMTLLDFDKPFEIVIVEDGSTVTSEKEVQLFNNRLDISYYKKPNSGPGDSRNYGMKKAQGNYFLILDSDVILPTNYLKEVEIAINQNYVDCFGGVDNAHASFSDLQKAINFVMTSFLTTGGIRGGGEQLGKFQPRSFNMGISRKAFEASGGFGKIHPGEDPDLSLRLWDLGFETALFSNVEVYHKRRISWAKFKLQVFKFGKCRPILNSWHPKSAKLTYWFPTVFVVGFLLSLWLLFFKSFILFLLFTTYLLCVSVSSTLKYKSLKIGAMSLFATFIQFWGYGVGFLWATIQVQLLKKNPEVVFPELFFKNKL